MQNELEKLRIAKHERARRDAGRGPWGWVVLGLLLMAGGGAAAWQWQASGAGAPVVQVRRVRAVDVAAEKSAGDLVLLNATGYVIAAHRIDLASKVVGRVAEVRVEMGDKIEKGEVLVRLEDDEYRARVAQAKGLLENAKAKLAELQAGSRPQDVATAAAQMEQARVEMGNADVSYKRMKELAGSRSVSQQQVDDAEMAVESRRAVFDARKQQYELVKAGPRKEEIDAQAATVRQLEGALALSMVDLENTVIRSPISGTVLERNVEMGEFVTTGFVGDRGAKGYVLSIADLKDLRVELDISQNDFAKVSAKQDCWIVTDAYPDKKYRGEMDLISPQANRQKATVLVRVKVLDPDDFLKPDMNATVSFLAPRGATSAPSGGGGGGGAAAKSVVRVPSRAVKDGTVLVVEDGRAVKRAVNVGLATANGDVEVKDGLMGGEDLIVGGPEGLKDGDRVRVDDGASK